MGRTRGIRIDSALNLELIQRINSNLVLLRGIVVGLVAR
jgi:hypothetical protein